MGTSGDAALPGSPSRAEGVARRESSWGIALSVSGKTSRGECQEDWDSERNGDISCPSEMTLKDPVFLEISRVAIGRVEELWGITVRM